MPPSPIDPLADAALTARQSAHLLRTRRVIRPLDATHVEVDGRRCVNFCSNDYLGLTHHADVLAAAESALRTYGSGAGAAPLITGYTPAHQEAEQSLAAWKGTEAALLLPSGYQANHAAVQTLAALTESAGKSVRFLVDKLAHASLFDAVRATAQPFRIFPHNGIPKLRRLLQDVPPDTLDVVITESIFSMDGDAAYLPAIAALKQQFPFTLLLDEAHATGVYGPNGSGYAAELGLPHLADVTIVTLSKVLGGAGGAICSSAALCNAVVNFGRAYIYSTSIPASAAAAASAALRILLHEPARQNALRAAARRLRAALQIESPSSPTDSPIIPIPFLTESAALHAADQLLEQGLLVLAIRPPTVPRGTSRLRVTVSSQHTDAEIDQLVASLSLMRGAATKAR